MRPKNLKFPYRWDDRKPLLQDRVLFVPDYYDRHHEFTFPGWEAIFGNTKPVVIEYCTGNGTWIAEKAKDRSKNWVAVEWDFERVQKIWSKMKNYGLDNLFIVSGEAVTFAREYLPPKSVSEVYVNFPDPWPKEKHAKNRLFQRSFIEELDRTLMPTGTVTVVTDDPTYSEQIVREMGAQGGWEDPVRTTEWEGYGSSYFDTLWREKGKTIRYFQFRKRSTIVLPANFQSDLDWKIQREQALEASSILWEFDFGGMKHDPAAFSGSILAIEHFTKTLWEEFAEKSRGVVLFRGSLDIVRSLHEDEVEGANILGDLLHRLASFLPDEATPYCLLDTSSFSKARAAQLMSKARFWHLQLSLKENNSNRGVLLPSDQQCTTETLSPAGRYATGRP